jgi:phage/plasmid-associated DNA primase
LTESGKALKAARMGDCLMRPHPTIIGVYEQSISMEDFINETLRDDGVFQEKNFMPDLHSWFRQCDHRDFPLIDHQKCDSNIIAFTNGYLDINTLLFYTLSEFQERHKRTPVTFHCFEKDFNAELCNASTPNWDKLIAGQWSEEVCEFFEVCIGRLFYPVGMKDNYQFMPMLKGDGNTGKSTIISAIGTMMPASSIDVISANLEKTFGLQGMNKKRLIVFPDIPENLSSCLPQTIFQAMVSGDEVKIPQKNLKALNEKWVTPMIAAGNYLSDYKDNAGSISRRFIIFPCLNFIAEKDTRLLDKIKAEIATIVLRCLNRYADFVDADGGKDIWSLVPKELADLQQEVRTETNELQNFLANGDSYYDIIYDEKCKTSLTKFRQAFKCHLEFHTDKKHKWTNDYFPFKSMGFIVKEQNICKSCELIAQASPRCCEEYHSRNRKKVTIIQNMRIQEKNRAFKIREEGD